MTTRYALWFAIMVTAAGSVSGGVGLGIAVRTLVEVQALSAQVQALNDRLPDMAHILHAVRECITACAPCQARGGATAATAPDTPGHPLR